MIITDSMIIIPMLEVIDERGMTVKRVKQFDTETGEAIMYAFGDDDKAIVLNYDVVLKPAILKNHKMVHRLTRQNVEEFICKSCMGVGTIPLHSNVKCKECNGCGIDGSKLDSASKMDYCKSKPYANTPLLFISGVKMIEQERLEQFAKHDKTIRFDVENNSEDQLRLGVIRLLFHGEHFECPKGWDEEWWSRTIKKPLKERIIISGALLAAELDRLTYIENH